LYLLQNQPHVAAQQVSCGSRNLRGNRVNPQKSSLLGLTDHLSGQERVLVPELSPQLQVQVSAPARGVPRCRTATGRRRGELRRPSIWGDHSPVARVLESPPGSTPSVNSALTGARRRPVPTAQTPLLRQRASPAAARRLFPERCRQRASFAGVRRVRLCGQVSSTSHDDDSREFDGEDRAWPSTRS
jgi:hypothetical protein